MTEQWRAVPSASHYEVSSIGRVRRHGRVLAHAQRSYGKDRYCRVRTERGRGFLVHRLVAEAFLGPVEGRVVNHKDRNTRNNAVENLEIVSQGENLAHALSTDPCVGGSWDYEDQRDG